MRRQAARHQSSRHTLTVHQRWQQRGRRPYPPLHSGAHRNQTRRVPRAPRPAPRWQEQQRRLPVRLAQSVRSALPPSPPSFEDERERLLRELPAGPLEPAYAHERAERKAKRKGEKLAQSAGGGEGGGENVRLVRRTKSGAPPTRGGPAGGRAAVTRSTLILLSVLATTAWAGPVARAAPAGAGAAGARPDRAAAPWTAAGRAPERPAAVT